MAINGLSVARRRVATIGLIVGTILLVASLILRGVDIYQTHHSISAAAAALLCGVEQEVTEFGNQFWIQRPRNCFQRVLAGGTRLVAQNGISYPASSNLIASSRANR